MPNKTLIIVFVLFLFASKVSWSQIDPELTPEDAEARIEGLLKELSLLETNDPNDPLWNRFLEVQKRVFDSSNAEELEYSKLYSSAELQSKLRELAQIKSRIHKLQEPLFEELKAKGRLLCTDRHQILATSPSPPTPELLQLGLDALSFPKIDGSTSTQPLAILIACRCFEVEHGWSIPQRWEYEGARMLKDVELELVEHTLQAQSKSFEKARIVGIINTFLVGNASTHQAYINILEGTSRLGLFARGPSAEELQLAKEKGFEFEFAPCALDAFVFMVKSDTPIVTLSLQQLRDIYSGKITQWQTLNPKFQEPIFAYRRPKNSGSEELMQRLVMKEIHLPDVKGDLLGATMGSVFNKLSRNKRGIAYSVRYYEHFMSGSASTRTIAVNNIEPNEQTIANRSYPLISEVYAVIRKDSNADSPQRKLYRWLLSDEGQAVVKQSGYVPVSR